MAARRKKNKEIRFRGTALDAARLEALATHAEMTPSATLRRLLQQACEHEGLDVSPRERGGNVLKGGAK
jgi:hypothetical protein